MNILGFPCIGILAFGSIPIPGLPLIPADKFIGLCESGCWFIWPFCIPKPGLPMPIIAGGWAIVFARSMLF
ncbi:hypothetical protein BKA70DRAFT_1259052 [Coprinopsis sp. MPI-PUGE-AT-0042]|nr:hypothetical protein BKA70DRAFT_1259052 [Coprinopsis sp. MPI-PUGE-AT-0042]